MHDAAYVFERFDEGIANFTKKEWRYSLKILRDRLPLINMEDIRLPFGRYLGKMLEFFVCEKGTNRSEMLAHYLHAIGTNDHGVLGALWLLSNFEKGATRPRELENYLSALAISFHNHIIFKHLRENNVNRINFKSFPIPFLLAFCDTAQIWGRRTRETKEGVKTQLVNIELSGQQITLTLFYATDVVSNIPDSIDIQGKDGIFKSSEYEFKLRFFGGKKWPVPGVVDIDTKQFY